MLYILPPNKRVLTKPSLSLIQISACLCKGDILRYKTANKGADEIISPKNATSE